MVGDLAPHAGDGALWDRAERLAEIRRPPERPELVPVKSVQERNCSDGCVQQEGQPGAPDTQRAQQHRKVHGSTMHLHVVSQLAVTTCEVVHFSGLEENSGESPLLPVVREGEGDVPQPAARLAAAGRQAAVGAQARGRRSATGGPPGPLRGGDAQEQAAPDVDLARLAVAQRGLDHAEDHLEASPVLRDQQLPQCGAHHRLLPDRQGCPHCHGRVEEVPAVRGDHRHRPILVPRGNIRAVTKGLLQGKQQGRLEDIVEVGDDVCYGAPKGLVAVAASAPPPLLLQVDERAAHAALPHEAAVEADKPPSVDVLAEPGISLPTSSVSPSFGPAAEHMVLPRAIEASQGDKVPHFVQRDVRVAGQRWSFTASCPSVGALDGSDAPAAGCGCAVAARAADSAAAAVAAAAGAAPRLSTPEAGLGCCASGALCWLGGRTPEKPHEEPLATCAGGQEPRCGFARGHV
mmetsp:Transcript_45666/g.145777  ORF Transcript_45666/g.145777 Transcript_45666/m.145777 type:complete len:462 (+) Transcript_45666:525-1910(+)